MGTYVHERPNSTAFVGQDDRQSEDIGRSDVAFRELLSVSHVLPGVGEQSRSLGPEDGVLHVGGEGHGLCHRPGSYAGRISRYRRRVFTPGGLLAGAIAAFFIGISKTGIPGAGILSIPLLALVVSGRMIPGVMIPLLIVADFFAIAWYRRHTRWDLLRPLGVWLAVGFAFGIGFFVVVGSAPGAVERTIGIIVLVIIALQLWKMWRESEPQPLGSAATAAYGTAGGFTTFVANAAGPVINTYLAGLRLHKSEFLGTAAWLYFVVNVAKIPFYLGLQWWTAGGAFFTLDGFKYDLFLMPAVVIGVLVGRVIYRRIPQATFLIVILVLAAAGAINLLF
jgi:uncharacterized membrane protein YfcA